MKKNRETAPKIEFTFDGVKISAKRGDSFASALADAGIYALKESAEGKSRGIYCGMGVCNECAIVVDGVPGKLACMTPAEDGAVVGHQPKAPVVNTRPMDPSPSQISEHSISPEVLVIGAGPAGLAATAVMAEAGLDVLLIDERGKLGGQYFKQPAEPFASEPLPDDQFREGKKLIDRVTASPAKVLTGAAIWGAFSAHHFVASRADERWVIHPQRVVIATGAYERGVPAEGWTTPGVMTTGAAQTLLRSYQVPLGKRSLISGNGPLNFQMAAELIKSKNEVVALAETARPLRIANFLSACALAWYSPSLVFKGMGYIATLLRAKVPILYGSAATSFVGHDAVEQVHIQKLDAEGKPVHGDSRSFDVDSVALGFGFLPSNEIARSLGCRHQFDRNSKTLNVVRDEFGRTSVQNVHVVGDCGGVSGAQVAKASGVLAGVYIVEDSGVVLSGSLTREASAAKRAYRRNLNFQKHLWKVFAAPAAELQFAQEDTLICRCLSLTKEEVEERLTPETITAGALKRVSRVGMGICQGKYCGPLATAIAAQKNHQEVGERSGFAPQAPFRPTRIGQLAEVEPTK